MLPWKQRKWQILPVTQNLSSIYFPLAKFQLLIRANWINCLLNILKVLLNLHNFPLLNINCTEPYLGPLYRSDIIVQILNCKIPERSLLNGAIYKRFQRFHAGEDVRSVTSCKFLLSRQQPFSCHNLANDIYSETAKTVFSYLKSAVLKAQNVCEQHHFNIHNWRCWYNLYLTS